MARPPAKRKLRNGRTEKEQAMRNRMLSRRLWKRTALAVLLGLVVSSEAGLHAQEPYALPEATAGKAYQTQLRAEGGQPPLAWKVVAGELPPGIELQASGVVAGLPTTPRREAYEFVAEVSDSSEPPQRMRQAFWLVVKAAPLRIVPPAAEGEPRLESAAGPPPDAAPVSATIAAPGAVPSPPTSSPPAGSAGAPPEPECPRDQVDCRETLEASFYVGAAVDNFAGGEVRKFLNPQESGGVESRGVQGFDFAYRLFGTPKTAEGRSWRWAPQLWAYGETVHGVRSRDVNCMENATFPTCGNFPGVGTADPKKDPFLFILRNASSLEAFTGLRWEFLSLQRESRTPASLYLSAQAGFITVQGSPGDVADMHHVGLGGIITRGPYQGSYLEFGRGRTDLFHRHRGKRWLVDGFLSRRLNDVMSFFAQITVDADFGRGSDSIQSYFGVDFDLPALVGRILGQEEKKKPK